ncbi:UDP-N-acetylglucosamine--N-acetylmuramyl-(pentapeptide) pyrophosphoryl-undecaprenol N-acetylglucosamine transferase [Prochlorococcus sp. MIT 1300]|uniref:UDP-N-acetylglucosamine--N-acetylmuramyl- (pentapeptide) pyrophosphoryl-undecaprenol N-acetylglucosamine transferase n=1 Tax=Prochlorococcus sp. MIT 1300 TaxID=3096218 RepID=UPI002A74CBFB|nr:UDP-N-acetylglucosamine--N-acetylmuramyl-(pentapeptide) pyrophosphoryl-undecaprenol N-acetylglucosamine transferase [Prochlorococcus sp. MIT 1300]
MPRLLIAASGTGGHIFPALAVAKALPSSWTVSWLGVPDRLETSLVPDSYQLLTVRAGGLHGKGVRRFSQFFQLLLASGSVMFFLRRHRIEVVFTTGGYIAAPAILAAWFCGIPVVLHESNAIPGRVTRLMAGLCQSVAIGLPLAGSKLKNCHPVLTGTPVREKFLSPQPLPIWVPVGEGPLLVIIGGSQGALGLNKMVRPLFASLLDAGCRVVHITGENDHELCQLSNPNFVEKTFTYEIPGLFQHADLAISRAGAGSLSELAISGTPAILVPYPYATDQHQEVNAMCAAETGAAVIIHQHLPGEDALSKTVWRLLQVRLNKVENMSDPLIPMSRAMKQFAIADAQQRLINLVTEFK